MPSESRGARPPTGLEVPPSGDRVGRPWRPAVRSGADVFAGLRVRIGPTLPALAAWGVLALVIVVHALAASRAVLPVYWEDEGGYLANSRVLAGMAESYDLRGNPYSIGFSLLLVPLWWVLDSVESVYRGAVVVAALCGVAAVLPAWAIGRRFGLSSWSALIAAGLVALGPAHTSMSSFAVSENLSTLLLLTSFSLAIRFFAAPTIVTGILFGVASAAVFLSHLRLAAVLAATVIALALVFRRNLLASLAGLGALVLVAGSGYLLYGAVGEAVFGSASAREDRGLERLLSPDLGGWLVAAIGQSWYHAIVWAGLGVVGALWLVRRTTTGLRARYPAVSVWLVIVTLGSLLIAVSYVAPAISSGSPRFDIYTYGRYLEPVAYVFAVLGAIALLRGIGRRRALVAAGAIAAVLVSFVLVVQPMIPRGADSWFAPLNVGGMWWAPWPFYARIAGSPWWPMAVVGLLVVIAIVALYRRPRLAIVLLVGLFTLQSVVGIYNVRIPFGAPFASSLTLRHVLADPVFEGEPVEFDVAVSDPSRDVDSANQNAYQLFASADLFDSRVADPEGDLVVARPDWPRASELGAVVVAVDAGVFDNALWVLPGPLADRLREEGMIEG